MLYFSRVTRRDAVVSYRVEKKQRRNPFIKYTTTSKFANVFAFSRCSTIESREFFSCIDDETAWSEGHRSSRDGRIFACEIKFIKVCLLLSMNIVYREIIPLLYPSLYRENAVRCTGKRFEPEAYCRVFFNKVTEPTPWSFSSDDDDKQTVTKKTTARSKLHRKHSCVCS